MDDRHKHFRVLYDQNYDDLWRYCLRRCASAEQAEDVLSETFTVAWRRFEAVPEPPQDRPFLFGVARNLIRNDRRRHSSRYRLTERLIAAVRTRPVVDIHTAAKDDLAVVLEALHELSDGDQEILRLAAWEQLPHAEIAHILDCSVNAVGVRLHRARGRLAVLVDHSTASQIATERNSS